MIIEMPYIGKELSINHCRIVGRYGRQTFKLKPEVEKWMDELAEKVKGISASGLTVTVSGRFKDRRGPDIHNLHKVIGDAIQRGTFINDKDYRFIDGESTYGHEVQTLEIEISPIVN